MSIWMRRYAETKIRVVTQFSLLSLSIFFYALLLFGGMKFELEGFRI